VTVPSDELVCLATLLGLRVNNSRGAVPLVGDGQTPDEGMCELWRRIEKQNKGIPADIIFSSVPRIDVNGFRWAPRTLIQHGKYGTVYHSSSSRDQDPVEITEHGLKVNFPGIMLGTLNTSATYGRRLLAPTGDDPGTGNQVLLVRIPPDSERWYSVYIHEPCGARASHTTPAANYLDLVYGGNTALLLRDSELSGKGILVGLVKPEITVDGSTSPQRVRTKHLVTISPMAPATCFISSTLHENIGSLRNISETVDEHDKEKRELLRSRLKELISASEELRTALFVEALHREVSTTEEQVTDNLLKIADLFAQVGGIGGTWVPSNTTWLVD